MKWIKKVFNFSRKNELKLCKERIIELEIAVNNLRKGIQRYYMANYRAKCRVDFSSQNMVICVTTLCGREEVPVTRDPEEMKKIIMDLPLLDYGC